MTNEEIEKEADKYSDRYLDDKETTAAYHGWKAGYHFRDEKLREYIESRIKLLESSAEEAIQERDNEYEAEGYCGAIEELKMLLNNLP